ncbi:MAG: phosphatidate cytidylyltransferase [Planctomycetota bacterium]|jgi:phosphatidate cytidylyltransferase|nr:MAG: phosphatidate cytidylyltransferase [Planctomycetota bacterium]
MLIWRLLVSAILIPLFAGGFYLDMRLGPSAPILLAIILTLALCGAREMVDLLWTRSFTPNKVIVSACCVLVTAAAWWGRFGNMPIQIPSDDNTLAQVMLAYAMTILVLFLLATYRYREPGASMETLGVELLIVSYIGVLMGVFAQLRWVAGSEAGYLVIGSLLVVTKGGDVGAYFLGRLFGRRKLVPLLSPGKTWAGAVGALIGSASSAVLWLHFATPLFSPTGEALWQPPWWLVSAVYGLILGVTGLVGDLCESLIKRDVGKKDSSTLLPGFGGLLDLMDSVLYASPVAYVLWKTLPLVTWKALPLVI